MTFAILRRVSHGQSPMSPDRGHIHHRLIDMGFSQKQAVAVLYIISAILGLSAVVLTTIGVVRAMLFLLAQGDDGVKLEQALNGDYRQDEAQEG